MLATQFGNLVGPIHRIGSDLGMRPKRADKVQLASVELVLVAVLVVALLVAALLAAALLSYRTRTHCRHVW